MSPESKPERDVERAVSAEEFAATLRRVADALESGSKIEVRVSGARVYVPVRAEFSIEHEREGDEEELEFQIKWKN